MPTVEEPKRESVITIKLGYMEGSQTPDYVRVDSDCSIVDLIIAREALNSRIYDKLENPADFLAGAFESFAKEIDSANVGTKGDDDD